MKTYKLLILFMIVFMCLQSNILANSIRVVKSSSEYGGKSLDEVKYYRGKELLLHVIKSGLGLVNSEINYLGKKVLALGQIKGKFNVTSYPHQVASCVVTFKDNRQEVECVLLFAKGRLIQKFIERDGTLIPFEVKKKYKK